MNHRSVKRLRFPVKATRVQIAYIDETTITDYSPDICAVGTDTEPSAVADGRETAPAGATSPDTVRDA